MILEALSVILDALSVALSWFFVLLQAADALDLWLVCMGAFLAYRFLLAPIFGQAAGSDKAAASKAAKMKRDAAAQAKR